MLCCELWCVLWCGTIPNVRLYLRSRHTRNMSSNRRGNQPTSCKLSASPLMLSLELNKARRIEVSICFRISWRVAANGIGDLKMIVIYSIFLLTIYASSSIIGNALSTVQSHSTWTKRSTPIFANPINSEGSKYRGDITEEEAFLWFDEAMVSCPIDHQVPPPTTIRTNPKTAQLSESA